MVCPRNQFHMDQCILLFLIGARLQHKLQSMKPSFIKDYQPSPAWQPMKSLATNSPPTTASNNNTHRTNETKRTEHPDRVLRPTVMNDERADDGTERSSSLFGKVSTRRSSCCATTTTGCLLRFVPLRCTWATKHF